MMKLMKLILIFLFVSLSSGAFSQFQYSIDDTKVDKKNRVSLGMKIRLKMRSLFRDDKQKKADRKKAKQLEREEKKQKKGVESYQERQGKDKEITSKEKVSKRMKKMKKQSKRVNKDKPRENFFKRLFIKNKQKPVKFKK